MLFIPIISKFSLNITSELTIILVLGINKLILVTPVVVCSDGNLGGCTSLRCIQSQQHTRLKDADTYAVGDCSNVFSFPLSTFF